MAKINGRTKAALWLLIAPTALFIITFILYAVVNWAFSSTPASGSELFGQQPVGTTIMNVILFITGVVSVITWLPGLIVGIVLLSTKK